MANWSSAEISTEALIPQWGQLATWWQVGHIRSLPFWKGQQFVPIGPYSGMSFPLLPVQPHPAPLSEDLHSVWLTRTRSHIVSDKGTNLTREEWWKQAMTMGSTDPIPQDTASPVGLEHPAKDRAEVPARDFTLGGRILESAACALNQHLQVDLCPQQEESISPVGPIYHHSHWLTFEGLCVSYLHIAGLCRIRGPWPQRGLREPRISAWNNKLQLLPKHFALLVSRDQQARREVTVLAGITDPDHQDWVRLFLNNGTGWNTCPIMTVNGQVQKPDLRRKWGPGLRPLTDDS